jgi:hypothetical protein
MVGDREVHVEDAPVGTAETDSPTRTPRFAAGTGGKVRTAVLLLRSGSSIGKRLARLESDNTISE